MRLPKKLLLITISSSLALSACGKNSGSSKTGSSDAALLEELAPASWADAAARFIGRDGADMGAVVLTNAPGAGVLMRIDLVGLSKGWHGAHLHQIGNCSDYADGFKASGGHIDPDENQHGILNSFGPERADMPNIYAGDDGRATVEIFNDSVALFASEAATAQSGPYPLLDDDGFAIIIHLNADDHTTQPIGGAGERVACAAITGSI